MTDEEKAEEILQTKGSMTFCAKGCGYTEKVKELIAIGLAEGRKEKELSYKVGKVTKAELNKCKTIEEKMEWLGKVLGYAIFKDDMNYAVWVNIQKNNIIDQLEKENAELKADKEWLDNTNNEQTKVILQLNEQIEKMKCCENCNKYRKAKCTEDNMFYARTTRQCKEWELTE